MSKQPTWSTTPRQPVVVEIGTDPSEMAAAEKESRLYRQTALGQIGCLMVVDAPLPLLAQYIAELIPDEQQQFLQELLARLPTDALRRSEEAQDAAPAECATGRRSCSPGEGPSDAIPYR